MPPLLRGDPPAYRHPPYQGGQGGSNPKSIFNLIITSYLEQKLFFGVLGQYLNLDFFPQKLNFGVQYL